MKVFHHEKPGTFVKANAAQLQLLIKLMDDKHLVSPEVAFRLAGAQVFSAFHNFSNAHIQEAIDEATKAGLTDAVLIGLDGSREAHEKAVATATAKAAASQAVLDKHLAALKTPKPVATQTTSPSPPASVTATSPLPPVATPTETSTVTPPSTTTVKVN